MGNELRGRIQGAHIGSILSRKFPYVELFGLQSKLTQRSPRPEGILGQIELDNAIKLVNVLKKYEPSNSGWSKNLDDMSHMTFIDVLSVHQPGYRLYNASFLVEYRWMLYQHLVLQSGQKLHNTRGCYDSNGMLTSLRIFHLHDT